MKSSGVHLVDHCQLLFLFPTKVEGIRLCSISPEHQAIKIMTTGNITRGYKSFRHWNLSLNGYRH